ncbi:MAG TPA: Mur ligase family protein, partial [Xanthobacteraceae bacterium]|nr:Mur ligase family protein [Xanthobacteraceae bacterium]
MSLFDLIPLGVVLAFAYFAARRLLTYLHIFQQEEYDGARFVRWLAATGSVDKKLSLALLAVGGARLAIGAPQFLAAALSAVVLIAVAARETDPRRGAKKPLVLTARAKRIFAVALALALLSAAAIAAIGGNPALLILPVQLLPIDLVVANLLLVPVETRIQQTFWREAHDKLLALSPIVIAITGSYGKTSVKHILGHILEAASSALITPGSVNTPMGIARIVREQLQSRHRYFVVEMGAYGPGSIARLCRLAPPSLGVITAIGKAHFERFKSLDTVARTKFELAEAVASRQGTLITCEAVLGFAAAKAFAEVHADRMLICGERAGLPLELSSIRQERDGLAVAVVWHGTRYDLVAPLFGSHQGWNMALAFAAACTLGIDPETVRLALRSTPQIAHRLEVRKLPDGPIVIDDAYNANPVGFAAALDLVAALKAPSGRAILITPGMVELGTAHDEEHARIGRKAAGMIDVLLPVAPERITA